VDGYAAAKGKVLPCPFFLGVGRFLELDMGMGREMVLAGRFLSMDDCLLVNGDQQEECFPFPCDGWTDHNVVP
jgi:hypothetical protein